MSGAVSRAVIVTAWVLAAGCTPTERCEDRLAELDRSMAALIELSEPSRLHEGVAGIERVPVSPAAATLGDCVVVWRPGMTAEERERLELDLEVDRARRERSGAGGRASVCVVLDAEAPIGPSWVELAAASREADLRLVVAAPWTRPELPLPPWVRAWVEANPGWDAGTRSPAERLRALAPVIARADTCVAEGSGHAPLVDSASARAWTAHQWIEECRCVGVDVPAAAAIVWLAYVPRLPPHRTLPLTLAGAGEGALALPREATGQALADALAAAPGAAVWVRSGMP